MTLKKMHLSPAASVIRQKFQPEDFKKFTPFTSVL